MSNTQHQPLPTTHRALVFAGAGQPLTIETVPTPQATAGNVVVRVLSTVIEPSMEHLMSGHVPGFWMPTPFTPGSRCVGRVAAIGPDTTKLEVGQLVYLEPFVRGRDNTDEQILWGVGVFAPNAARQKLAKEAWRNGSLAEYAQAPLENCYALNEKILLGNPAEGGLGYSINELACLGRHLVAYGGLRGIDLKAGETIIVAPATGPYSSAVVEVASAMGAKVIAVGRNLEKLQKVAANIPRVSVYAIKGDITEDLGALKKFGPIDAYLDISPGWASESTHVRSCMMALRPHGRASLMGVINKDIAIPYVVACLNNLTIRGQYMYEREDCYGLFKLVEAGVLPLGKKAGHSIGGEYKLEQWKEGIEAAGKTDAPGETIVIAP